MRKQNISLLVFMCVGACMLTASLKQKDDPVDAQLEEVTRLLNKNDIESFLRRIKIDNRGIYHTIDTLGFGYAMHVNQGYLNDEIGFEIDALKYRGKIISLKVTPSFFRVKPVHANHYRKVLKKEGWIYKSYNRFEGKMCNFDLSAMPINDSVFAYRPKPNPTIDSLMSAHSTTSFDRIKADLSNKDLYYLLHSNNNWTRVQVIRYIKCNNVQVDSSMVNWISYVVKNSPPLMAQYTKCLVGSEPVEYFLDCDYMQNVRIYYNY